MSPRLTLLAMALWIGAGPAGAVEVATATSREPRAFGHTLGAVVERVVVVELPRGHTLDDTSLPRRVGQGQPIELREAALRSRWQLGGTRHELTLHYQVMLSPPELRTLELPPVTLRVKGPARTEELRVDAWPLLVGPLSPVEARLREGLGDMRPDAPPPLVDTGAARGRLWVSGALALVLLGYLGWVYLGLPWAASRRRPFALAWRTLRGLPREPTAEQRLAAYRRLHEALNRTAGHVVFVADIARFAEAHPRFLGLQDELRLFFARSNEQFFAAQPAAAHDAWLLAFGRRCRDAERGTG
jgi:mxaA protein